jgi:hypothetical protein
MAAEDTVTLPDVAETVTTGLFGGCAARLEAAADGPNTVSLTSSKMSIGALFDLRKFKYCCVGLFRKDGKSTTFPLDCKKNISDMLSLYESSNLSRLAFLFSNSLFLMPPPGLEPTPPG